MNIEDVLTKYFDLKEREEILAAKQAEEMKPISEAKEVIKNWLLHQMNVTGSDQFKVQGVGIAFKSTQTSVSLQDPVAFKEFVFAPVVDSILNYVRSIGYPLGEEMRGVVANILRDLVRWDVVDFRAGKKGIQEYQENEQRAVPGVAVTSIATVSIRKG